MMLEDLDIVKLSMERLNWLQDLKKLSEDGELQELPDVRDLFSGDAGFCASPETSPNMGQQLFKVRDLFRVMLGFVHHPKHHPKMGQQLPKVRDLFLGDAGFCATPENITRKWDSLV